MSKLTSANPLVTDRRTFLKSSTVLSAGLCGLFAETLPTPALAQGKDPEGLDIIGPKPGYSPQVGTLVSMLTWMREANGIITATKGLTEADLDRKYLSLCDPRLNFAQALEMAFLVGRRMGGRAGPSPSIQPSAA